MNTQHQEVVTVEKDRIACDGGDGGLGHPRVWLQISEETKSVTCPYCDKRFVRQDASSQT